MGKTKIIKCQNNFNILCIMFELNKPHSLTNKEIKNVLKVLNRPGYLNGIKTIYFNCNLITEKNKEKIIYGIKGFRNSYFKPSNNTTKYISFYEPGVEYGYMVSERYPM